MSFCEQLVRKRQSAQATKILPEPSISAEGSGPLRMPPGSVADEIEVIQVDFSESHKFAIAGLHCATLELVRDQPEA